MLLPEMCTNLLFACVHNQNGNLFFHYTLPFKVYMPTIAEFKEDRDNTHHNDIFQNQI